MASRRQLAACGVTSNQVAHRVATQQWQALGPAAVVLHGGPLSVQQQQWVAVVHSGPGSALVGITAATAAGLAGWPAPVVRTVVPHFRTVRALAHPRVRVRPAQWRALDASALHPVARPARQRTEIALIRAAMDAGVDGRARLLLLSAVQQRLVRPGDLRAQVIALGWAPRRAILLEGVEDAEGGVHSLPEREVSTAFRRAGLPVPTRQRRVQRANGCWYLDLDVTPWLVSLEVDGSQHDEPQAVEYDEHRRNVSGPRDASSSR